LFRRYEISMRQLGCFLTEQNRMWFRDPMNPKFFNKTEARNRVGCRVEALADFPSVPAGNRGAVTRACKRRNEEWVVSVEWDLSGKSSEYFAMLGDLSFNFRTRSRTVLDEFSKDEFERLVTCVEPTERSHSR